MKCRVFIVGVGPGSPGRLTKEVTAVIRGADIVVGSSKALRVLKEARVFRRRFAHRIIELTGNYEEGLKRAIKQGMELGGMVVVASTGDPTYAGLGRLALKVCRELGVEAEVLPGISSLQAAASKLGIDWGNAVLVDLHSNPSPKRLRYAISEALLGRTVVLTLHTRLSARDVVSELLRCGYAGLRLIIAENLDSHNERLMVFDSVREDLIGKVNDVSANALLIIKPEGRMLKPLSSDDVYKPSRVPGPTKAEVRAVIAGKACLSPGETVLEVGCGTGALTIELARHVFPDGLVIGVDLREEAVKATIKNASAHGLAHLIKVFKGSSPSVLGKALSESGASSIDAAVIDAGVSLKGSIEEAVKYLKPGGRLVVVAVTIESLTTATETIKSLGLEYSITQVIASRSRKLGRYTSLSPLNPVTVIQAVKPVEG